ncbi:YeaH/YhbH family protein [Nitrincola alkalilacustris]|uniref:YeaH/YhbH family protein n=1 Tax=Nitrincola alkalilacustris TaxID=1571224 RepID=UPI00124BDC3E|nr:YeaH/YhbH family protein [Nitrincola alkalilacustris]
MSYIIDRRLNAKKKSTVNRQRFLRRYKEHIKRAVEDAIHDRSIIDMERGSEVSIPSRDISEPVFHHGNGGVRQRVFPGNKEFVEGDEIRRPSGGGGGGGSGQGQASNQGEGEDEFTFNISQEEFLDFMFEDLELPYLVRKKLKDATQFETRRAGFSSHGSPEKLHIVRSLRAAHARRIALAGKGESRKEIRALRKELWVLEAKPISDETRLKMAELREQIQKLEKSAKRLPFIDDFDLRYNNLVKVPVPSSKAVMFCLMDVSGSMTQSVKDMAKRFFILLYLFLQRNYKQIEVVFVRHHTHAKEVDEQEFFYSRETGGTIVSSALNLSADIIDARYSPAEWNIYVAQASDGDNWDGDSANCRQLLSKRILPKTQYYAYVEITSGPQQNLWYEYEQVRTEYPDQFAMQQIREASDIYPVFRKLFEKRTENVA